MTTLARKLEEALARLKASEARALALEQALDELEAFSFSVSHDLRSPLRVINGCAGVLLESHAGKLDVGAMHMLERIHPGRAWAI